MLKINNLKHVLIGKALQLSRNILLGHPGQFFGRGLTPLWSTMLFADIVRSTGHKTLSVYQNAHRSSFQTML
jgi:hypothetical protein